MRPIVVVFGQNLPLNCTEFASIVGLLVMLVTSNNLGARPGFRYGIVSNRFDTSVVIRHSGICRKETFSGESLVEKAVEREFM